MLATFGLQRLEAGLEKDTVTATDVAEFLAQAEPVDVRTLARGGMPEALDRMQRRIGQGAGEASALLDSGNPATDELRATAIVLTADRPALSRLPRRYRQSNRQFAPRRRTNRV